MINATALRGHTVLALHAHPDDEAIFTGITLRRLADAGVRVVLVVATAGDLGRSRIPLAPDESIARRRVTELEQSAALLGVDRLVLLGRRDSGLPGWASGAHARALAGADPLVLASRLAELADAEGAATLIYDDEHGIYAHPDHRAVHHIGSITAELTGATSYRITVDREHLHASAPGEHLVHRAAGAARVGFGRVPAEISLTITGGTRHLAIKHAAVTAHASQIGPDQVPADRFDAGYGREWFVRHGAPGVLDSLGGAEPTVTAARHGRGEPVTAAP
ncbi:PIG-L deacetylase family protein [Pseudonocardia asaccharolytica]|uniref:GlcNAc-PI de-N-acetylase n=1 Tax=Pseudonocardia asaccharolytica DSM 44247 = NBRC 16224 TaxID=1123024 RepID=A0A511D6K3_9PSEU|nr:PIG-L deacetylase family protein [Pseudonocardia asaccharolytica]GEL20415.1 GlcNAc-PI de-N-acetylase [Pseudonocardia asaccharolytica DSM 44247 = NBRC 16224]